MDPTFGLMTLDPKVGWKAEPLFEPVGRSVQVTLPVGAASSAEGHRLAFLTVKQSYQELRPAIGLALFQLFEDYLPEWEDSDQDVPRSPQEMLAKTVLWGIQLQPSGAELLYAFVPEVGWDDAMFTVIASGGTITPGSLDD